MYRINLVFDILGALCDEDFNGIKAWKFSLTVEDEDLLTEAGKLELKKLGERYKKRLPTLFEPNLNKVRIIHSAYRVLEGTTLFSDTHFRYT